jgi:pimeloyl-ACP methyl ester carboxylesterase
VRIGPGVIHYRERGEGPPVVFVHGAFVNGDLWRQVVPVLARSCRCLVPDWPLGAHPEPMAPHADLSPPGLAAIVDQFLAALDLDRVTLVGNDTGGAVCQLVAAHQPERLGGLVLLPCDAFENFPPPMFRYLAPLARSRALFWLYAQAGRIPGVLWLPFAFGWVSKRRWPRAISRSYARPIRAVGIRRDSRKMLLGLDPRHTLEAARLLQGFERPALVLWAREDRFFPFADGERLAAVLPQATLVPVEDSWTYVSEDRPDVLARALLDFTRAGTPLGPT